MCVWYMCVLVFVVYVCACVCVAYVCVCLWYMCVFVCMVYVCTCVCVICVCVCVTHIDLPEGGLHHLAIEDPPAYKNNTCQHIRYDWPQPCLSVTTGKGSPMWVKGRVGTLFHSATRLKAPAQVRKGQPICSGALTHIGRVSLGGTGMQDFRIVTSCP